MEKKNKDIKVIDTLNEIYTDQVWWAGKHNPIEFFAEAVARTRIEGPAGVSIENIAKCFKSQFDASELSTLIKELKCNSK
jgi:hypothetical protein